MGVHADGIIIGLLLMAGAVPYVAHIRHPDQKPLAAYLIFVTVLFPSAFVLFEASLWLAAALGWQLGPIGASGLGLLAVIPAVGFARALARKPPVGRPPPR